MRLKPKMIAVVALLCGGCNGLTATIEPIPEDKIVVAKDLKSVAPLITILSVTEYREAKRNRISMLAKVSIKDIPDGAVIKTAYLRFRLASAVREDSNGEFDFTWSPKFRVIQKALKIQKTAQNSTDQLEITAADSTRDPETMSLSFKEDKQLLVLGPDLKGVGLGEEGQSYHDLLARWNPARDIRLKTNSLWLEIGITQEIQKLLEEDTLILWLEGPVGGSNEDIGERYHGSDAQPGYLRPYLHVDYEY